MSSTPPFSSVFSLTLKYKVTHAGVNDTDVKVLQIEPLGCLVTCHILAGKTILSLPSRGGKMRDNQFVRDVTANQHVDMKHALQDDYQRGEFSTPSRFLDNIKIINMVK